MSNVDEEVSLELELATNRCRMELVSIQAQYYMLIIKGLYIKYLKQNENIEKFTKEELLEMLQAVENTVNDLETESLIDGTAKYDMRESLPFITECITRVMGKYGFVEWEIS